ncbi:MAG: hypothetical protein RL536_341 [Candidatus Parcubacteria bacterium]|jgi:dTDP-glucose 4,6-dehydratase/UDP-glucuronate decarboxylase
MNSSIDLNKLKGKKILVTGATGFLGQHIVAEISNLNRKMKLGCIVDALGLRFPRHFLSEILRQDRDISYIQADLSKQFNLSGYDFIFHAAGYGQPSKFVNDPQSLVRINIDATVRLIEGSPKATLIFFSSAEVYGEIPEELIPVREDYNGNPPLHTPRSVYAESKRLGEALCAAYKRIKEVNTKIIRISHVYGPGLAMDDTRVMSEFIKKALNEKKIKLLDSGSSVKTYGYVADIVSMILFVVFEGKEMVYNVGGKDSISILELARKIASYCKVDCEVPATTSQFSHIGKEPPVVKLDLSRIEKEMGKFRFTTFDDGLAKTIEWTKSQLR